MTGGALWNIEFATAIDITNLGGKAVSLVDMKQSNNGDIETFFPPVQASVRFDYFKTAEDFNKWFSVRSSPSSSWIEQSINKFDFSGPPITIGAGETHRILLWAGEWVSIDKGLTPQDVHKGLYDVNWNSEITFVFADGTTQQQSVRIIHPYQFEPQNVLLKPFEACPKP